MCSTLQKRWVTAPSVNSLSNYTRSNLDSQMARFTVCRVLLIVKNIFFNIFQVFLSIVWPYMTQIILSMLPLTEENNKTCHNYNWPLQKSRYSTPQSSLVCFVVWDLRFKHAIFFHAQVQRLFRSARSNFISSATKWSQLDQEQAPHPGMNQYKTIGSNDFDDEKSNQSIPPNFQKNIDVKTLHKFWGL